MFEDTKGVMGILKSNGLRTKQWPKEKVKKEQTKQWPKEKGQTTIYKT